MAVAFRVYSQEAEQPLPLSLQVVAVEHPGESTQIPLLVAAAEADGLKEPRQQPTEAMAVKLDSTARLQIYLAVTPRPVAVLQQALAATQVLERSPLPDRVLLRELWPKAQVQLGLHLQPEAEEAVAILVAVLVVSLKIVLQRHRQTAPEAVEAEAPGPEGPGLPQPASAQD